MLAVIAAKGGKNESQIVTVSHWGNTGYVIRSGVWRKYTRTTGSHAYTYSTDGHAYASSTDSHAHPRADNWFGRRSLNWT